MEPGFLAVWDPFVFLPFFSWCPMSCPIWKNNWNKNCLFCLLSGASLPSCNRFWHLFDHWYLQMGGIDEAALDKLSLVTEMTKHIRVRASSPSQTHSSASEIGQFSPFFLWLLRVCDSPNLLMVWLTSMLDLNSNNNMLQVCIVWWFAQCIAVHSWPSAALLQWLCYVNIFIYKCNNPNFWRFSF